MRKGVSYSNFELNKKGGFMESSKLNEMNGEGFTPEHRIDFILIAIALVFWITIILSIHNS